MTPGFGHMNVGDEDHELQLCNERAQASSFAPLSSHVLAYSSIQDQGSYYPTEAHQLKYPGKDDNFGSGGGLSNDQGLRLSLWMNESGQEQRSHDYGRRHQDIPTKWLPSKLRLVRRMMRSDQTAMEVPTHPQIKINHGSSSPTGTTENSCTIPSSTQIRVCSDCNTTKTPLWRSGPRGPKSLCNACGIRQRKARRAMAEAAAATNGTPTPTVESTTPLKLKVQQKDKRLRIDNQIAPCKKRSKLGNNNGSQKQLCFEDFLISLSKNLAFHQVFPQDEKEAAILLMALSCGLVHG